MDKPNLRDLLSYYGVELHSQRREQSVCCPVHEESRPSCSVNEDEGLLHCLSCGFGGDAWSLIMKKEGFDEFGEAIEFARTRLNWTGGDSSTRPRGQRERRGGGYRPTFKRKRILS